MRARPKLEVATELGVPIFVHPVAPQPLPRQMFPMGSSGLCLRGSAARPSWKSALAGAGLGIEFNEHLEPEDASLETSRGSLTVTSTMIGPVRAAVESAAI